MENGKTVEEYVLYLKLSIYITQIYNPYAYIQQVTIIKVYVRVHKRTRIQRSFVWIKNFLFSVRVSTTFICI